MTKYKLNLGPKRNQNGKQIFFTMEWNTTKHIRENEISMDK
jgi:hypothetical protein